MTISTRLFLLTLSTLVSTLLCGRASACVSAVGPGDIISIAHEDALIVWNGKEHREDFIRRADFDTNARDFGFLVPVPTTPTLTEVDKQVFKVLDDIVNPQTKGLHISGASAGGGMSSEPDAVTVVAQQEVAGYDTTTLSASDPARLRKWLTDNAYQVPDGFDNWIQPYLDKHWQIVAFKMTRNADAGQDARVSSRLVRITFLTEKPYYPYSEPPSTVVGGGDRELRVYFVASTIVEAHIGDVTPWGATRSKVTWLRPRQIAQIGTDVKIEPKQLPATPVLTYFVDDSYPRKGTADVWFESHR